MAGETPSESTPSQIEGVTLAVYRAEYANADIFCQRVQDFISEAGIPALNELRNAGYHLMLSLDDHGAVAKPGELSRAINHAKRACYEAGEAGVLMALDQIRAFKEDFRGVRVSQVIPNFVELMAAAERARESILANRTSGEDRGNDYQLRISAFNELRETCRTLEAAKDECVVLADTARIDGRRFVTNVLLGLFGIAVTIALAIIFG